MIEKFGDVDKFEFAANLCKGQLAVYLETHSRFWSLIDMKTTRDEAIDLESGEIVPVGHIRKVDLDFGRSCSFDKFELTISCSILLRQLK